MKFSLAHIKKTYRFLKIYSLTRTITKIVARLRLKFPLWIFLFFPRYFRRGKTVGLIGCGHHTFSSLAFYLSTSTNFKIIWAYDINKKASDLLKYAYKIKTINNKLEYFKNPDIVYIASNHSSHTQYAINYIKKGCDVYVEKPISINLEQFKQLCKVVESSNSNFYVGYNRPHSAAIKLLSSYTEKNTPFTLNCYVIGHVLEKNHWYRKKSEGSRIVSNLGHWIDLFVHINYWSNKFHSFIDIKISYSDIETPSENISISIITPRKDLISIVFSTRNEPYEGVTETINFQCGNINAKIDDFRKIEIWKNDIYISKKYYPKDNGHKLASKQPNFDKIRNWDEIKTSTKVMLYIEEMVQNKKETGRLFFN